MGRKSKLTDERITAIINCIKDNIPYKLAAESNGITEQLFYSWLRDGEQDLENEVDSLHAKLFQKIKSCETEKVRNLLLQIQKGEKNWQSHAWILDRHPCYRKFFSANAHELEKIQAEMQEIKDTMAKLINKNILQGA